MPTVNVREAKTQLSKLLDAVAEGEEVIISKAGKPAAKLVPVESPLPARKPGSMKGKIRMADDFDSPLPDDIQAAFEGK
jgi:prevent-host-death family protein